MGMKTISDIIEQARQAAGNYGELANLMPGAKAHTPRDWGKRESIPSEWVLYFCNACAQVGMANVTPVLIAKMQARPVPNSTPDQEAA